MVKISSSGTILRFYVLFKGGASILRIGVNSIIPKCATPSHDEKLSALIILGLKSISVSKMNMLSDLPCF